MQAKKAQGDFLMSDVLGLSGDVTATRKRPSSSNDMRSGQLTSEDGQLTILGSSAPLSAAIADLIHKEGLSHTLSESPLLARVIKLARTVPASYNPPTRRDNDLGRNRDSHNSATQPEARGTHSQLESEYMQHDFFSLLGLLLLLLKSFSYSYGILNGTLLRASI